MLFMKEDLKIKDGQVEVLAGIMNICALVGSLTAGWLSDWLGRRCTIVVASVIFLIGSVLMGMGVNFAMLFSGRCVAGVGVGYALMVAPVYSAEISSPATRGFLTPSRRSVSASASSSVTSPTTSSPSCLSRSGGA